MSSRFYVFTLFSGFSYPLSEEEVSVGRQDDVEVDQEMLKKYVEMIANNAVFADKAAIHVLYCRCAPETV